MRNTSISWGRVSLTLSFVGRLAATDAPPVPLIFYLGHGLKLAGGAVGGWLAATASGRQAARTAGAA